MTLLLKWLSALLALLVLSLDFPSLVSSGRRPALFAGARAWSNDRKLALRNETRALWYHGFDNYMLHAFPSDELTPLSCSGRGPDWSNPDNIVYNDVAGNYSLTLVDVLDTLVVLGDRAGFERAVRNTIDWVSFDVNTKPQVFEVTIRVLGGLLSGHILASKEGHAMFLPWYRGELLAMAQDLGERLLPAFATPTGIPYARINLRHGVYAGESTETCTAGAGSLILEFGTLSRLTGDPRFEKAAYKAYFALWNRRSEIGLVGNTINIINGKWIPPEVAGIGAGIDSFFEYALKWYILSGDVEFLDVWLEAYPAMMRYARTPDGAWFHSVQMFSGDSAYFMSDSLSAFWPGLQVLGGDIQNAIKSHLIYWNIWKRYSGIPEVFDIGMLQATSLQYPLRPEFIESTWYLYRATRDPFYLDVGERVLQDITRRSKVDCGLASIGNLTSNRQEDRMDSFVLSETLKYLFLLFDEENLIHSDGSNYILSTEGHILELNSTQLRPMSPTRRKLRGAENNQCPVFVPNILAYNKFHEGAHLFGGIGSRPDIDYLRKSVGMPHLESDARFWIPEGWCDIPAVGQFTHDFVLSSDGYVAPENIKPSQDQLTPVADGFVIQRVTGIKIHIVSRLDGAGYDVTRVGPYPVRSGQLVYVNDTGLQFKSVETPPSSKNKKEPPPDVQLHFFADGNEGPEQPLTEFSMEELFVDASPATFASPPMVFFDVNEESGLEDRYSIPITRDPDNTHGCTPFQAQYDGGALLVSRGECTFFEKLLRAKMAGASAVVVASHDDAHINPTADAADVAAANNSLDGSILLLVGYSDGKSLSTMIDTVEGEAGRVWFTPASRESPPSPGQESIEESRRSSKAPARILYVNGHALMNTRLLI